MLHPRQTPRNAAAVEKTITITKQKQKKQQKKTKKKHTAENSLSILVFVTSSPRQILLECIIIY